MNRYFKVEGNILYPDQAMLTWGPFYYHSLDNAKERMNPILQDIVNWCNSDPWDYLETRDKRMIAFKIKAWKTSEKLEVCKGMISVEEIFFEDKLM